MSIELFGIRLPSPVFMAADLIMAVDGYPTLKDLTPDALPLVR